MSKDDMQKEYQRWLYEEPAVLKEGRVFLLRNRQTGSLAVKKHIPISLKPIYEAIANMNSPVLPRILSMEENGDGFIVLEEYIHGRSLRNILGSGRMLDEKETLRLGQDLCEALEQLHEVQPPIIHRDIKPENIILSDLGRYVLIDFDAARQFSVTAEKDTVHLGTHGYAAPEQYGFGQSDERTDLYALGVTLYEAYTGKAYVKGAKLKGKLGNIIAKCTSFDVNKRYKSAKVLRKALAKAAQQRKTLWAMWNLLAGAVIAGILFAALWLPYAAKKAEASDISGQWIHWGALYMWEDEAYITNPIPEDALNKSERGTPALTIAEVQDGEYLARYYNTLFSLEEDEQGDYTTNDEDYGYFVLVDENTLHQEVRGDIVVYRRAASRSYEEGELETYAGSYELLNIIGERELNEQEYAHISIWSDGTFSHVQELQFPELLLEGYSDSSGDWIAAEHGMLLFCDWHQTEESYWTYCSITRMMSGNGLEVQYHDSNGLSYTMLYAKVSDDPNYLITR